MSETTGAVERFQKAAESFGLSVSVRIMPESARSAEEAAKACGCSVHRIVKSLVFRGAGSGKALLFLVAGGNRVDEKRAGEAAGEPIERPDAAFVRAETGFAIGGIPPIGHARALPTYVDEDLLAFETVWAAAGTPHAVFEVEPAKLVAATGATVIAVK